MTKLTRYARHRRLGWLAMATNVDPEQAVRHSADPEWGEEEAVYVPNALAAGAPALLEAAKDALRSFVYLDEEAEYDHHSEEIARLRAAIAAVEGGTRDYRPCSLCGGLDRHKHGCRHRRP